MKNTRSSDETYMPPFFDQSIYQTVEEVYADTCTGFFEGDRVGLGDDGLVEEGCNRYILNVRNFNERGGENNHDIHDISLLPHPSEPSSERRSRRSESWSPRGRQHHPRRSAAGTSAGAGNLARPPGGPCRTSAGTSSHYARDGSNSNDTTCGRWADSTKYAEAVDRSTPPPWE